MISNLDIYTNGSPSQFGALGYYGLLEWWNSEFTVQERANVTRKYIPMGGGGLAEGQVLGSSASVVNFLTGLQSWFTNLSDEAFSERILLKGEQLIKPQTPILDIHFLYGALLEHYYKKRKLDPKYYDLAKHYCVKQIELATDAKSVSIDQMEFLPAHKGDEQLAIILEKERNWDAAIQLCRQAQNQAGILT